MDIWQELGELALGSRLRKLGNYLMSQAEEIYKTYNINFDPRCFTAFYAISQKEGMSIMELSKILQMSHPALIHQIKILEKGDLIVSKVVASDRRKKMLILSPNGKALLPQIQKVWRDVAQSMFEMVQLQNTPIMAALQEIETNFVDESMMDRVLKVRHKRELSEIEIIGFKPEYAIHFKTINLSWIEKYFIIEAEDDTLLNHPKKHIIDTGGDILFAKIGEEFVGTCGLKKLDNSTFELIKMGVLEKYQGRKIGKIIGLAIIERAKELGAKSILLESNKTLTTALNLYKSIGFKTLVGVKSLSDYERCDITMELKIKG